MSFYLRLSPLLPLVFFLFLTPSLTLTLRPLPPPLGPYNTTFVNVPLTESRLDPYAPTPMLRRIMLSIFTPILPSDCDPILAPYMPAATATFYSTYFQQLGIQNATFDSLRLRVCSSSSVSSPLNITSTAYPIILFSPGFGASRLIYSYLAQSVASNGYTVITIDHPYDAPIVTYPDNSTITVPPPSLTNITDPPTSVTVKAQTIRSGDVLAVIHALRANNNTLPVLWSPQTKIAMFGHSLGGATTLLSLHLSPHLAGGLDLDGSIQGDVALDLPITKPFLFFGRTNDTISTLPSWGQVWPLLQGPKWDLELAQSAHLTFSDLPLVVDVLELFPGGLPAAIAAFIGTLNAGRALEIVGTYVSAFMGFVAGGKGLGLLGGESTDFPEVDFVATGDE